MLGEIELLVPHTGVRCIISCTRYVDRMAFGTNIQWLPEC